jgi:SpoVK/Ycf46/Vps4 family AAA+-type ATPase
MSAKTDKVLQQLVDRWGGQLRNPERAFKQMALRSLPGVRLLFAGPNRRRKTQAVRFISDKLNLRLYRLDLSVVLSKYIGETEKNLDRMFDDSQTSGAILFFDEADALFGTRTNVKDAHNRYAEKKVSCFLRHLEKFQGAVIISLEQTDGMSRPIMKAFPFRLDFSGRNRARTLTKAV